MEGKRKGGGVVVVVLAVALKLLGFVVEICKEIV